MGQNSKKPEISKRDISLEQFARDLGNSSVFYFQDRPTKKPERVKGIKLSDGKTHMVSLEVIDLIKENGRKIKELESELYAYKLKEQKEKELIF